MVLPTTKGQNLSTSQIQIDLRDEYDLREGFKPNTKTAVIEFDSYLRLLDLLTPAQRDQLHDLAVNEKFLAVSGYVSI